MRRITILSVRTVLLAALAAAIIDLPLPARSSARTRLHLIDRSDSVRRGPKDAPGPADADHIRRVKDEHPELRVIPRTRPELVEGMLEADAEGAVVQFADETSMREFARRRLPA